MERSLLPACSIDFVSLEFLPWISDEKDYNYSCAIAFCAKKKVQKRERQEGMKFAIILL